MGLISKILIIFVLVSSYILAADTDAQLKQADKFRNNAQFTEAISLYTKILNKRHNNTQALFGRAQCYLMTEELDKVIQDMNLYISIDSLNADAYNTLGVAKLYSDSTLYSMNEFNKAISLDSNFEQAYINRATVNMSILLDSRAEEDLKKAITLNPNNPMSHNYYGFVLHRMERYDEAIEQFNIAISQGYNLADMYLKRGNSFFKLKKYKEAIDDYNRTMELDSSLVEAINNRAYIYHQMGEEDLAVRDKQLFERLNNEKFKSLGDGVDVSKLKYFEHPSGMFSIEMPAEFNNFAYSDTFALVQITSKEKITSSKEAFSVGVIIEYISDTKSKMNVNSQSELISYCKELVANAMKDALVVQPFFEKQKNLSNNDLYQMNKFSIQFNSTSPKLIMFMVEFLRNNSLISMQFVYPEEFDLKYDSVVQNAVTSFKYK